MFRIATSFAGLLGLIVCSAAGTAPVPKEKETPRPTVAALRQAMNKSHLGKEVRAIGKQLGETPVIDYFLWSGVPETDREDDHFFLIWKSKGIDMSFFDGKLRAIFLYNEGADGHNRYAGELPEVLSFDDDVAAIEKKLGKPDDVTELPFRRILGKGPEVADVIYDYDQKGLSITTRQPKGGQARIHDISLKKAR